eukprot:TRINITY_DN20374_c0_g1_i1.p1 TRINITY_DN20374_c0_g1~~TRINITY_DN20374_c0_g1_i1.p1  ORF type:complete len:266 (+),score=85.41 TRINITY_DN20374_c0_g1_i1:113-799(+)
MPRALAGLLALLALPCATEAGVGGMLTFALHLDEMRCFFEEVSDTDSRIYVHVTVLDGGFDLNFDVQGPFPATGDTIIPLSQDSRVIYSENLDKHRGEGRLLFRTTQGAGTYRICLHNGYIMAKAVSVVIKSSAPEADPDSVGPHKPLEPIQRTIVRISEALNGIKEDQSWLKTKERSHRDAAESACSNILWWSAINALMLVALGGSQIWYYNNLFKDGKGGARGRGA